MLGELALIMFMSLLEFLGCGFRFFGLVWFGIGDDCIDWGELGCLLFEIVLTAPVPAIGPFDAV